MKLNSEQVKKVAKLASLPLSNQDEEKYAEQLSAILDYMEKLSGVDTAKVESTYNVSGNSTVMRPDQEGESLGQEEATQNGSNVRDGFFVTKGVFEE